MPKQKDPTRHYHYPFIFFVFVDWQLGAQGRESLLSGAARWDDDTSTVLSTAVTSPEAEERGVKANE